MELLGLKSCTKIFLPNGENAFRRGENCRKTLVRAKNQCFSVALKIAVRGLCSGCTSNLKCVQSLNKPPPNHHMYVRSYFFMQQSISPSILGIFQTALLAQLPVHGGFAVCTVGSVVVRQMPEC